MRNKYIIKSLVDDMVIKKELTEDEYELVSEIFEELCIDVDVPIAVIEEASVFPNVDDEEEYGYEYE